MSTPKKIVLVTIIALAASRPISHILQDQFARASFGDGFVEATRLLFWVTYTDWLLEPFDLPLTPNFVAGFLGFLTGCIFNVLVLFILVRLFMIPWNLFYGRTNARNSGKDSAC